MRGEDRGAEDGLGNNAHDSRRGFEQVEFAFEALGAELPEVKCGMRHRLACTSTNLAGQSLERTFFRAALFSMPGLLSQTAGVSRRHNGAAGLQVGLAFQSND